MGHAYPEGILTNADLEKMVDTNDEWIITRTGIKQRHKARDDEYTSQFGVKAARQVDADLAQHFFNDVVIVEQPFRVGCVRALVRSRVRELPMRPLQHTGVIAEAAQQTWAGNMAGRSTRDG